MTCTASNPIEQRRLDAVRKGPNLTGIDPDAGALISLFYPHQERWDAHFTLSETLIVSQMSRSEYT